MIKNLNYILGKANKGNYAVAAFNVNNMEFIKAITNAANNKKSPLILQTSEGAIDYAGLDYLYSMMEIAAESVKIPISIHLDHGRDMKVIKKCIDIGYSSVMIDASHEDFEKNIKLTKKVVSWASKKNVSVEAELGTIGGTEDKVSAKKIIYTDPEMAVEFVKRTGIDALAIAIGTSHGAHKFLGSAKLNIEILKEIKKRLNMPLVLHGASSVPQSLVKESEKYGAKFKHMVGVPNSELTKAVNNGINKVNTDTDLRLAFLTGVRKTLAKNKEVFDPRKILKPAMDEIEKVVEKRIDLMGSGGKA